MGGAPAAQWLRRAGYTFITDRSSGQDSFVRRLGGDFYPRFHLYVQEVAGSDELYFNLHLDQKKASYEGQSRHSGEYEGELVEGEVARLQSYLQPGVAASTETPNTSTQNSSSDSEKAEQDVLHTLRPQKLTARTPHPKKTWWQKLFS
ncbi:hypothetical protein CVU83_00590 [Candidatus Falkowbacteria bacterium HGW-Falkowbacteria-2]|uniref:Uncharacterized protein n=1 Tax=Candidatus Falkowbacteria bacterium HGW-Falkowbacteria-2 TaxID=2013769 RepID=A0A2N2E2Z6_9BACT|nr:MAG: hypothetical protein CVU83_00590 [Candidatus Falkowbacteria bacterium HGW-Falkowbacteria-2]